MEAFNKRKRSGFQYPTERERDDLDEEMDVNGRMVLVPSHDSAVEELDVSSDAPAENENLDEYLGRLSAVFDQFLAAKRKRSNFATAQALLIELKDLLKASRSLPPSREGTPTDGELTLARDIYEWAALMSGYSPDPAGALITAFDQLKPYYSDEWKTLPLPRKKDFIYGRYLLALLEKNEFDKFRIELQSLSDFDLTQPRVVYAVKIEKLLSEQAAREKTLTNKGTQEIQTKVILRRGSLRHVSMRTPPSAHPPFDFFKPRGEEAHVEVRDGLMNQAA